LHRLIHVFLLIAICLPCPTLAAENAEGSGTPKRRARAPEVTGLELGVRGGWFFQLGESERDTLADHSDVQPDFSLGVDLEAGAMLGNNLSIMVRVGYQSSTEVWPSPEPAAIDDMKIMYSLLHLPSVNVKFRPLFKRLSFYVTGGGGLDLMVYEHDVGYYQHNQLRQVGGGLNGGVGLEFFITAKVALAFDVRYHLSFHEEDTLTLSSTDEETTYYDIVVEPTHHALNLFFGLEFRP